jgi:hypothetical protein
MLTVPAVLLLIATILAGAAAFGVGTGVRTRIPNLGWLAVCLLCLALFWGLVDAAN